ncbi:MAG: DCC1-like thiol-disulfide oxidoreductase family protein [Gemmatimonadota bacterium]|nr:DCC1-like thiol-disulfide oxidoreductase family protein [Gemmatimonadota bacterium]
MANPPVLLYDGTCGFCQASVQFVLRHERTSTLRFAPLQGELGAELRARHPALAGVDSVVWVDDPGGEGERLRLRSDATLRVARYLGGGWRLLSAAGIVPRFIRDSVYRFVARHRHRIVRGGEVCDLPAPEARSRFLD